MRRFAIAALVCAALTAAHASETYEIDSVHSDVSFKIRHLVSRVKGGFKEFSGKIDLDRSDLTKAKVSFAIAAASIDTGNTRRDDHLRSSDFFEVEAHPRITFESTSVRKAAENLYDVTGKFTMHGVTKEITIPVEVLGFTSHPRFGDRAGFTTSFTLDREDYGITWNSAMDAGGFVLGRAVQCEINLETVKIEEPEPVEGQNQPKG